MLCLTEAIEEWIGSVQRTLIDVFRSAAALLRFVTSRPVIRISPQRANLGSFLDHAVRGLLEVRDDLLARRESIATVAHELAVRTASHQQLVAEIRNAKGMTEDLWIKMQSERMVSPFLRRLADLGLAQSAIYDLLKAGFTSFAGM